jgi:hypothetical protein
MGEITKCILFLSFIGFLRDKGELVLNEFERKGGAIVHCAFKGE